MKLRNKRTGEIVDIIAYETKKQPLIEGIDYQGQFETLAELNEEWEDALEEPKEHWCVTMYGGITRIKDDEEPGEYYIDCDGEVYEATRLNQFDLDRMSNIGNLFETKEEAELAVRKLKAWKRLKDKGFRFIGIAGLKSEIYFCADEKYDDAHIMFDEYGSSSDYLKQYNKDLDFLFGGEK